jgi:ADP-heptose:LPS heptosyltransferase
VFYTDVVRLEGQMHVIRQNLALIREALGIGSLEREPGFPISTSEGDRNEADLIVEQAGSDFAILNPAGGWVTKLWPAENYGKLADRLWDESGLRSVIAIGPKEEHLAAEVLSSSSSGGAIVVKPTLKGFYELAKRARVYVGGDTGPTHLAIAAGTPVVGIFGPTEWWRNGSLDPDDICIERLDIGCRIDCHRRKCSKWICMDISPQVVFDAVQARLARKLQREAAPVLR